jgi:hypothetical protein
MSEPTKDNTHILSDPQAFQETYARARGFFETLEGVVGVSFGQKQTGGVYGDDISIVVFVKEKKKSEELAPEQRIADSFEGYRTDVRVVRTADFHGCDNTATYDTIQGGIQIIPPADPTTGKFAAGTLGCIIKKRNDSSRENVYLLSNKHVLLFDAKPGDYIYHPFCPSPDTNKFASPGDSNVLGPIQTTAFLSNVSYTPPGGSQPIDIFIDCGTARIDVDSKCLGTRCTKDTTKYAASIVDLQILGVNTIADVRNVISDSSIIGQNVVKVGRTTGKTVGIVRLINAPVDVPADPTIPGSQPFTAQNTIEIDFDTSSAPGGVNCKGHAWFSEHGDSGALILDNQGRAIGLLSVGPRDGASNATPSNGCHIFPILDNLQVCISTVSGTTHGSCGATDGSGTSPAASSHAMSVPTGDDGSSVLAAKKMATTELQSLPDPPAASEAEIRHLQELLVAFRSTEKGRQLHDIFAQVRREIGYLVRNSRPVKVAWHRSQGPQFLKRTQDHLRGAAGTVPYELNGVSRTRLFMRMGEVLSRHGSNPLRKAIERHGEDLMDVLNTGERVDDWIAHLRNNENKAASDLPV